MNSPTDSIGTHSVPVSNTVSAPLHLTRTLATGLLLLLAMVRWMDTPHADNPTDAPTLAGPATPIPATPMEAPADPWRPRPKVHPANHSSPKLPKRDRNTVALAGSQPEMAHWYADRNPSIAQPHFIAAYQPAAATDFAATDFAASTERLSVPMPARAGIPGTSSYDASPGNDGLSTGAIAQQLDQAILAMRHTDRSELSERRLSDRQWVRLTCDVARRLDAQSAALGTIAAPDGNPTKNEHASLRSALRSLLAAIAVSPEYQPIVTFQRPMQYPDESTIESLDSSQPKIDLASGDDHHDPLTAPQRAEARQQNDYSILTGKVQLIQQTKTDWFVLLAAPQDTSRQYTVRIPAERLHQPISAGDRMVVVGRFESPSTNTKDAMMSASEVHAISPERCDLPEGDASDLAFPRLYIPAP